MTTGRFLAFGLVNHLDGFFLGFKENLLLFGFGVGNQFFRSKLGALDGLAGQKAAEKITDNRPQAETNGGDDY
jgi:hypothetical protein